MGKVCKDSVTGISFITKYRNGRPSGDNHSHHTNRVPSCLTSSRKKSRMHAHAPQPRSGGTFDLTPSRPDTGGSSVRSPRPHVLRYLPYPVYAGRYLFVGNTEMRINLLAFLWLGCKQVF